MRFCILLITIIFHCSIKCNYLLKHIFRFKGSALEGLSYKPLFDYFSKVRITYSGIKILHMLFHSHFETKQMKKNGAFKVITDGYVTEESGTGVVHQAPYFGEVNYLRLNSEFIGPLF